MYEVVVYEVLVEAVTPIAHHSETMGNHAVAVRRKVRQPDGAFVMVPVVSGDAMRHGMREASAYAFLDAAGLLGAGELSEAALRLLFTGGMVTGRGDASNIKLDDYRKMVECVPPLALLGGCASNRVIPGRIVSEDLVLVCEETKPLVPSWMLERAGTLSGARAHLETHQRVRMDATLDPGKVQLLSEGARAHAEGRLLRSEDATIRDDIVGAEDAKTTMMPRTFEAITSGALFSWRVQAMCLSELDVDTFHAMVGGFLSHARVGGKRGTGFGMLRPVAANRVTVHRPAEQMQPVNATALGPRVGELFRSHVAARKEQIRDFLRAVDA